MKQPKNHLKEIFRSPSESFDRTCYLRLDKNEDVVGLPDAFIQSILSKVSPDMLAAYPQLDELYIKLSDYLSVDREQILITAGSDAAIKNIFEVYIEPGDKVVMPEPTYAMYDVYSRLFQASPEKIRYDSELNLSLGEYIDAITDAALVVLANPNSPTGTVVERSDIIQILNAAENEGALVLIDEAYYPYYPLTAVEFMDQYRNLIVTRTFSKAFCLASLRLGYAVSNPSIIRDLNSFRPIYESNSFATLFGCALLDNMDIVEDKVRKVIEGREYIIKEMEKIGLITYPSNTNFVHIRVGERHVLPLSDYLKEQGILVKSGFSHGTLKECIRISIGPVDTMRIFVSHLENYMAKSDVGSSRSREGSE
jgi:histidinol-phosphate aminotransferase